MIFEVKKAAGVKVILLPVACIAITPDVGASTVPVPVMRP